MFELSLPFQKKSILIVDDSPYNLFILQELLLTMENVDREMIKQALNGQEALDMITSRENLIGNCRSKFDIIFLDLHMPVLDGFQTIQRLREL